MGVSWTEEQQKVISLRNRNILVSAAAGSGKTAVLVERILSKITDPDNPVDIDRLLIMTFTRAAAGEMKERISAAIDKTLYDNPDNEHLQRQATLIHNAQITTIDGFCAYIIRNYFHMIELDPGYRTADEGELKLLREDVVSEVFEKAYEEKDENFLKLVECYATGKTDDNIRDMIYKLYDAAMSHPFPEKWMNKCLNAFKIHDIDELRNSDWMKIIWDYADVALGQIGEYIDQALNLCADVDGPSHYESALKSDELLLIRARKILKKGDYNEFVYLLRDNTFESLSRKRPKEVDDSKKERVKSLRESEKDLWKELKEQFFNQTEEKMLEYLGYCRKPMEGLVKVTLDFKDAYSLKKREDNIIDFTDMEHFALNILMHVEDEKIIPSAAARELSDRYDEVMVDEYQDSNMVQELITNLVSGWAGGRKNIFMVGDVKQSIYRFRLARPELFMEKYHSYSLDDSDEQRVDLHKNFRSRGEVLSSVNYIFRQIMGEDLGGITYDDDNALYTGASFPPKTSSEDQSTEVLLIEKDGEILEDDNERQTAQEIEALTIAHRIKKMVGNEEVLDKATGTYRKVEYGDIAILLRSASGWAEVFGQVLSSNGIPVYTASRTGYFSTTEVVTMLNYLRICDNPRQDIPLTGVLHSPIVGCTVQELAMIRSTCPDGMIYDSIIVYKNKFQDKNLSPSAEERILLEKLEAFLSILDAMREKALYTPVHELLLYIMDETGYGAYAKAIPGGAQRNANLKMLVEKAMDYEKTSYRGLFNFVRYIEKLQKYEVDFGEVNLSDAGSGAVQIMTIHKSKGLEFPVVFAAGMGKQFNFQDVNAKFLIHPELGFGTDIIIPEKRIILPGTQKQIIRRQLKNETLGEELRVLYVALTRAKEKLIITGTIAKIESVIENISVFMGREETLLPIIKREGAKDYWSYILPALARHPAMLEIFNEFGITHYQCRACEEETNFVIKIVRATNLVQTEILEQTDLQFREKIIMDWDADKVYDEEIRKIINERFGFTYPYEYLRELPVKLSVSELKKRNYHSDDEREEAVHFEPDIIPLIPEFISGENNDEYKGAARGTAYHRLMECLDYNRVGSREDIKEQLAGLVLDKKMSEEEAKCIRISDIMQFVKSDLGIRMREAFGKNKLYREQPFVISQDMKKIEPDWRGDEKILVQGIIDAYFYEDDEIILVDYKTDWVKTNEEQKLVNLYRTQLEDYADALTRLIGKKVKEKYIYSFALGKMIRI